MADCPAVLLVRYADGVIARFRCIGPALPPGPGRWHSFRSPGAELAEAVLQEVPDDG